MEASGARRPERGAAYLRWRGRSRAVAPASWASAASPAALAAGHGARPGSASSPPGDGPAGPAEKRTRGRLSSDWPRSPPQLLPPAAAWPQDLTHAAIGYPEPRPRDVSASLICRFRREAGLERQPVGQALRGGV